ncbi:MAG: trypsin-like serine protease [Lachnospiraceae bacterium]|nr:trypsin-like serine protease [Lachnospiraceae bacterium]
MSDENKEYETEKFYQSDEPTWKPDEQYNTYNGGNYSSGSTQPPRQNKSKWSIILACVIAVLVIGFGVYYVVEKFGIDFGGSYNVETPSDAEDVTGGTKIESTGNASQNNVQMSISDGTGSQTSGVYITDVSQVVENVMPSIVAITSKTLVDSGYYGPWYDEEEYYVPGAGSGIIIGQTEEELLIVTNKHVVSDTTSLEVQFVDGTSIEAYTKATSFDNDIAIVSIPLDSIGTETLDVIKIATIGRSDSLKVGQGIIAIGNALGYGQSVTVGVVSALNREVQVDDTSEPIEMIQLDAAINGGNSGGALLNSAGEVVGINSAKYSATGYSSASIEGMGFAIPISDVLEEIEELMNKETRYKVDEDKRGYLGIAGGNVDSNMQMFGYPSGF